MKDKTAMQMLIEELEKQQNDTESLGVSVGLGSAITKARELLAKEREQICEAFILSRVENHGTATYYFTQKYE